jgi:hypothetical protein
MESIIVVGVEDVDVLIVLVVLIYTLIYQEMVHHFLVVLAQEVLQDLVQKTIRLV